MLLGTQRWPVFGFSRARSQRRRKLKHSTMDMTRRRFTLAVGVRVITAQPWQGRQASCWMHLLMVSTMVARARAAFLYSQLEMEAGAATTAILMAILIVSTRSQSAPSPDQTNIPSTQRLAPHSWRLRTVQATIAGL